jgi:hypothetical protein
MICLLLNWKRDLGICVGAVWRLCWVIEIPPAPALRQFAVMPPSTLRTSPDPAAHELLTNVRFRGKADMAIALRNVR